MRLQKKYFVQQGTNSILFTKNNFAEFFFFDILLTKMELNFYKLSSEVFGVCGELILSVISFKKMFESTNQEFIDAI